MTTTSIYLAVILVIIVLVAAFFARRYLHRGEHFSLVTPATPLVREAVGGLFSALRKMASLSQDFETASAGRPEMAMARNGIGRIAQSLSAAEKQLVGSPPTYVNYLAIYRGLAGGDAALLAASDAYIDAGYREQQKVDAESPPSADDAHLGNTLTAMGNQLREVVASVHRLGVALDVE